MLFCGCKRKQEYTVSEKEYAETEKALVGANRLLLKKDKERILAYISQHKLDMKESETGPLVQDRKNRTWQNSSQTGSKSH